jgi:hypothetical protein
VKKENGMKKLLLATVALLAMSVPGHAIIIADLGINPNSSQGDFSNHPGGGLFSDQYTFQLIGGPQFFTIASVTNVFPNVTDFITGFSASVFRQVGAVGGGDDIRVIGPTSPVACLLVPNCQVVAGSAVLNPGNYYAQIDGIGGGTSGYGGNLSTAAVPGPIVGAGLPGLLGMLGFGGWKWWRRRTA